MSVLDIKMESCGDTVILEFGDRNRTFITTKRYIMFNFITNTLEETDDISVSNIKWTNCKEVSDIEIKKA
jgi:hypothetical protein